MLLTSFGLIILELKFFILLISLKAFLKISSKLRGADFSLGTASIPFVCSKCLKINNTLTFSVLVFFTICFSYIPFIGGEKVAQLLIAMSILAIKK